MLLHLKSGSLAGLAPKPGALPGIILGVACRRARLAGWRHGHLPGAAGRDDSARGPSSQPPALPRGGNVRIRLLRNRLGLGVHLLQAAQTLLDLEDVVNTVELKLDDIYQAPAVKEAADRLAGPKLAASTWMEQNKHILGALNMERVVTFVTIGLIVLVAALNILITLIMMVMEKNRDIAILVSMGARQEQVRRIFMFQGVLIGVVGTAIGLIAGHLLSFFADRYRWIPLDEEVYALSFVPFDPRWIDSLWVAALALFISFVATIYPARNASRVTPAESLRYE